MADPTRSFLSTYSGSGGLGAAGGDCVSQVEIDRDCAETLRGDGAAGYSP